MEVDKPHAARKGGDRVGQLLLSSCFGLLSTTSLDERLNIPLENRAHSFGQWRFVGQIVPHAAPT
jgi:hypothetical protein